MKIEKETGQENWADYIYRMSKYQEDNEPNQLEDLLLEDHPLLPGEDVVFEWLKKNLIREPRVKLDETGLHVVPIGGNSYRSRFNAGQKMEETIERRSRKTKK